MPGVRPAVGESDQRMAAWKEYSGSGLTTNKERTMKAIESKTYDRAFPENFNWSHLDSPTFSDMALTISNHIIHELHNKLPADRNLTPGLRKALNLIAEVATIYQHRSV